MHTKSWLFSKRDKENYDWSLKITWKLKHITLTPDETNLRYQSRDVSFIWDFFFCPPPDTCIQFVPLSRLTCFFKVQFWTVYFTHSLTQVVRHLLHSLTFTGLVNGLCPFLFSAGAVNGNVSDAMLEYKQIFGYK